MLFHKGLLSVIIYGFMLLVSNIIRLFLSVKAVTLIFISGRGSAISSAIQGKSGSIYNLVKNNKLFVPCKRTCIS